MATFCQLTLLQLRTVPTASGTVKKKRSSVSVYMHNLNYIIKIRYIKVLYYNYYRIPNILLVIIIWVPHHYGNILSADPLTTENSAYGLGYSQEKKELSKCKQAHRSSCIYKHKCSQEFEEGGAIIDERALCAQFLLHSAEIWFTGSHTLLMTS